MISTKVLISWQYDMKLVIIYIYIKCQTWWRVMWCTRRGFRSSWALIHVVFNRRKHKQLIPHRLVTSCSDSQTHGFMGSWGMLTQNSVIGPAMMMMVMMMKVWRRVDVAALPPPATLTPAWTPDVSVPQVHGPLPHPQTVTHFLIVASTSPPRSLTGSQPLSLQMDAVFAFSLCPSSPPWSKRLRAKNKEDNVHFCARLFCKKKKRLLLKLYIDKNPFQNHIVSVSKWCCDNVWIDLHSQEFHRRAARTTGAGHSRWWRPHPTVELLIGSFRSVSLKQGLAPGNSWHKLIDGEERDKGGGGVTSSFPPFLFLPR